MIIEDTGVACSVWSRKVQYTARLINICATLFKLLVPECSHMHEAVSKHTQMQTHKMRIKTLSGNNAHEICMVTVVVLQNAPH